jgi:ribosomal protein S18 acetylase RimI-like enzyme
MASTFIATVWSDGSSRSWARCYPPPVPPSAVAIRNLRPPDIEAVVDVLSAAFTGFPVLQVLVGTDGDARARLRRVYAMELEPDSDASAVVAEQEGRIVGAITFSDSPACSAPSAGRTLRFMRIAGTRVFGAMRVFGRIERVHPKTPHRHLPTVGVDPDRQGEGIGRLLMEDFVRRCDEDAMGSYLETIRWSDASKPSHERFYRSLGFEVSDVLPMTDTWQVLTMTRPARSDAPW